MDSEEQQPSSLDAPQSGTSFTASWTPRSKAAVFDVNNVPIKKTHRAWERKPTQSVAADGKIRTVWKRYALRSQPGAVSVSASEDKGGEASVGKSPGRIVKKARVGSPVKGNIEGPMEAQGKRKSSATRYERRKSGYRRKLHINQVIFSSVHH
jgi:hypothetical protein